jgi:cell division protein FtsI/penicillin-binding protein 2
VRERLALVIASVIALAVVGGALVLLTSREAGDPAAEAREIMAAYLRAWENEAWDAMQALAAAPPGDFASRHSEMWEDLSVVEGRFDLGTISVNRGEASALVGATLTMEGLGEFSYDTEVTAQRDDGEWRIVWSTQTMHPALEREQWRIERRDVVADRAPILARDGTPLTVAGTLHLIGIEPQRVDEPEDVVAAFDEHTDVDPADVRELLNRDDLVPDWFYPLMTVRPGPYAELRELLFPVAGIVFRETEARLTQQEDFAAHILGRTGPITAELLEELGPPYTVRDEVGLSGLERAFETTLAGRSSAEVVVIDSFEEVRRILFEFEGADPEPVRTTLDIAVQQGVETALDGVSGAAAIVVLDAPTGAILGASSRPVDDFHRAFSGLYPPGSSFKIVTAAAVLASGLLPTDSVDCPAEEIVGGLAVHNDDDFELGNVTLLRAFAASCNTSFARLAAELEDGALDAAAEDFGFDVEYELPLPVAGGRFPEPEDLAERAAAAFGQARVQASPLHMASVAAAVASGEWNPPFLLQDEPPERPRPLDEDVVGDLSQMMREVVTAGTGQAALPGEGTVHGKTGSAQTGSGSDDPVHAWFVGYAGDLAFAVLVEGGGSGGEVAAPLAATLLDAIDEARSELTTP